MHKKELDIVDKVYTVYEQYIAKHLINDCHFKLLYVKPDKYDPKIVMFRFEDTPELREEIHKFKESYNK